MPRPKSTTQKSSASKNTPQAHGKRPFHVEFLNQAQKIAWAAFDQHDVLFLLGSAGSGKTHLATAFAISEILAKKKSRIIITRPIVEAGESLGYLPGSIDEKTAPYMLPLFDCIERCVGKEGPQRELIDRSIEVAPLAYMRGRATSCEHSFVLTPTGFVKMGEIKKGDFVIGSDGKPTEVLQIFPQGKVPVYKVKFSDHTEVICSGDHLWSTQTLSEKRHNKGFSAKTTLEIKELVKNKHIIPILSAPVEFDVQKISFDPYTLGVILSGGKVKISFAEEEVLKSLGMIGTLSHQKFVPDCYKINSIEVRLEVLNGLLDTDSKIYKNHGNCKIQYVASKKLADDVMFLVRSLGGNCNSQYRDYDDSYIVDINMPMNPFKLQRKAMQYKNSSKPVKLISSVEEFGEDECQCIAVDAKDHLYLTNDFIVTHNTFNDAICIFDEAQNATASQLKLFMTRFGENSKIIITGDPKQSDLRPSERGLMKVVDKLQDLSGIGIVTFKSSSIVRHPLIASILDRLDDSEE